MTTPSADPVVLAARARRLRALAGTRPGPAAEALRCAARALEDAARAAAIFDAPR